MKEGVYHVSAHHDGWEDIRENVLNYDEEGGGEEDQVNNTHIMNSRWGRQPAEGSAAHEELRQTQGDEKKSWNSSAAGKDKVLSHDGKWTRDANVK